MSKTTSVVEINGNKYDAASGRLLGVVRQAAAAIRPGQGQVLDGFRRRPLTAKSRPAISQKPAETVHQRAQQSRTLMRTAVRTPEIKALPKVSADIRPNRGIINSKRSFRAKTVLKNPRISRFTGFASSQTKKAVDKPSQPIARPSLAVQTRPAATAIGRPLPSLISSASHNQLERMLDHALIRADAHKKALRMRARGPMKLFNRMPRWFGVSLIMITLLLAGGLFVWQKVPAISLKVAATRAHIDASTPSYLPYGFSLAGPASYNDGVVTTELSDSANNGSSLKITQQASNLNSQSLAEADVPKGTPVQSSQVKGSTVYIYGKGEIKNATWVNKGIKFKIENQAKLSTDELFKIANGL
ncbi:DUF4367 domain-containing protein [Candidatus Saccharibacteria bacterium]|nr:DUF4367 domain-containing protein [Candidatus Saccharibacteria bacterium]